MKFRYDLGGGQTTVQNIMVHTGGSNALKVGAAVGIASAAPWATVIAGNTLADVVGVLQDGVPATPDSANGTVNLRAKAIVNPLAVFLAEYGQTTVLTATSSSGTTVTVPSLVTVVGQWIYVTAGTGVGQLILVATGGTGSFTASVAPSPALDNTSKLIVIQQVGSEINGLTADGTQLLTTAAAPSGVMRTIQNFIVAPSMGEVALDPVLHNGITVPSAKLFAEVLFLDHAYCIGA